MDICVTELAVVGHSPSLLCFKMNGKKKSAKTNLQQADIWTEKATVCTDAQLHGQKGALDRALSGLKLAARLAKVRGQNKTM